MSYRKLYTFGPFRFDATERVLTRGNKIVRLTPKAVEVLSVLLENHGHVLDKDELMRRCWPDVIVEEANLAQTISILRKALGEDGRGQKYIHTVARRGYRFDADVKVTERRVAARSSASPANSERRAKVADRRRSAPIPSISRVSASETGSEKHGGDPNEAHHLYLRGRYYWSKYTVESLNKGLSYFRRCLEIDPNHALAHLGLADCYYRLSNLHLPPTIAMPQAKEAILKALKLDHTLAEAHSLLGLIMAYYDHAWRDAETSLKRAIELAPSYAGTRRRCGNFLGFLGRFDQSVTELKLAIDLEPRLPQSHVALGTTFYVARRYEAAVEQAQQALDLSPDYYASHTLLALAWTQQGKLADALEEFQTAVRLSDLPWSLGCLGYAYGLSGQRPEAVEILAELERQAEGSYVSPYAMALVYAGLARREDAMRALNRAYRERNEMLIFLKTSPEWDSLRSERGFVALLKRMGL